MYKSTDRCPDFLHDSQRSRLPDEQHKTDTIPDSTADINAAPTAEPAEGESWAEPVVLVKENPPGCRSRPILRAKSAGLSQTA